MSGIVGGAGSKSGIIGETELDYEEGAFTVTIAGAAGVGPYGLDEASRGATYTKIGRVVNIWWSVGGNSIGSVSGDGQINDLPFTCDGIGSWHVLSGNPFDGSCKGGYISGTSMYPMDDLSDAVAQWVAESPQHWKIWGTYNATS